MSGLAIVATVICALIVGGLITAVVVDYRLKQAAEYAEAEREDRDNQRRDLVCPANREFYDRFGSTR